MAIEYQLQKIIKDIVLYINFEILEFNVPDIFSGIEGFPPRTDGRYFDFKYPKICAQLNIP